jgi:hypothetical protein
MTMRVIETKEVIEAPAGEYFMGDPCYAVPEEHWSALLDSCDCFKRAVGQIKEGSVCAFGTAYGEGEYSDQNRNKYSVDAGIIGLTPVSMIPDGEREKLKELGKFVKFGAPVKCYEADGVISIGHYKINTND